MKKTISFLQGLGYPVEQPKAGSEALYGVVWMAERAQQHVAETLKPFGLTPSKFNYLMIIKHIGGAEGLSQREMGSRLLLKKGNVTKYLDHLQAQGWIVRAPGPDRRSHRIQITPKGDQLLEKVWPVYEKAVGGLVNVLPQTRQHRLVEILNQWREALDR